MPKKIEILPGDKYARLTIIKEVPAARYGNRIFLCRCDCGKTCKRSLGALRKKSISSCGCFNKELNESPKLDKRTENHPYIKSRLYSIWIDMRKRCRNKNTRAYRWYGAKGISVCKEWRSRFLNFYNWAVANGYEENLTIERHDHTGNYEPDNCSWIPWSKQNNNKSNNRLVEYKGVEMTASQLASKYKIKYTTVIGRLNKGWSVKKVVETPVWKGNIVEHKGEEKSISDWARHYGLRPGLVQDRLSLGWTLKKSLETKIMSHDS